MARRPSGTAVALALAALAAFLPLLISRAEEYKWVDKHGTVHFTDNPEELPEPFRSKALWELQKKQAEELKKQEKAGVKPPNQPTHEQLPEAPDVSTFPNEIPTVLKEDHTQEREQQKKSWRERMSLAREFAAELEKKCQELKKTRDQDAQASLIFARPADRKKAKKSATLLQRCEQQLEDTRRRLEVELPEEARRLGIPAGWLR